MKTVVPILVIAGLGGVWLAFVLLMLRYLGIPIP